MRPQTFLSLLFVLLAPLSAFAKTEEELKVLMLDGTIMVQHSKEGKPTVIQSGTTVEKGDILTVYDKSWVLLKTRRGDRIVADGRTVVAIDDYYDGGPDRMIRLILHSGSLLVRAKNVGSRQSFFEVNAGSVVASLGDSQTTYQYDSDQLSLKIQYLSGNVRIVDKNDESKLKFEHTENIWKDGQRTLEEPIPMDELDTINFQKLMDGEQRLKRTDENGLPLSDE